MAYWPRFAGDEMLELRLLGQFEVRVGGEIVLLPSRPAQSLLAYLALSAGTAHRREKLAGLLWPDTDETNARSNLRHALWRIRKAIEHGPAATPCLLSDELAVAFDGGADYWLDAAVLGRDTDSVAELVASVSAYRGELLPGFYDERVPFERERLAAVFQRKMQRLLDRLTETQRWPDVLEWGEHWAALGHSPEPAYRALMLAHSELGNTAAVVRVYERCREALFNDLGVQPSTHTTRLFERLTHGNAVSPAPDVSERVSAEDARPAAGDPPFQGLQYFAESDADRFFGRERVTAQLVRRLREEPFIAVVGASGSGKSSIVRAGLAAALRQQPAPQAWNVHVLTPTARPLEALADTILGSSARSAERVTLLDELDRDPLGLHRIAARGAINSRRRSILVVDQFEEVFTLCCDAFEREAFIDNLVCAAEMGQPGVVIALRADFYHHCAEHTRLREAVAEHQEYVGPMSPSELRRAIVVPAEHAGWSFEPGLVDELLRDVGEEPGGLPLLSHALLETWRRRRGRQLTFAGYMEAGGVKGAIAHTAETLFCQRLTPNEQRTARRIFLALTELGEGTQDTRRRVSPGEVVLSADEPSRLMHVLHMLADARLITLAEDTIEVAHEALIREWPRLRDWLNQDRENLRLHRQVADSAREWERLGRDPGGLYRGVRLTRVLDWAADHRAELTAFESDFLDVSATAAEREQREHEARRQREIDAAEQLAASERRRADLERQGADAQRRAAARLRQRAVVLAAALCLALLGASAAVFFGEQSRQYGAQAEANARMAGARELAAAAVANISSDPELAVLLALEGVALTYGVDKTAAPEAEDALHRTLPRLRTQLTLIGHTGSLTGVTFSPDGQRLATSGTDGTARVWDARTGQELLVLRGHSATVNAVAFDPNGGRRIATTSHDGTARLWDAETGAELLRLVGHRGIVRQFAFSPDGQRLATTSADGTVKLWDTSTGESVLTFGKDEPGGGEFAIDVSFAPDGQRLFTISEWGRVREWDLSGNLGLQLMPRGRGPDQRQIPRGIAISQDGTRLAATGNSGITLWALPEGEELLTITGHTDLIHDLAFSPDGARLASGGLDRMAKVWDTETGAELISLSGHHAAVQRLAFSPDGRRLATVSWDGSAKVWDLGPEREVLAMHSLGNSGRVTYRPDGRRILAGRVDATASVWDSSTGEELFKLRGHTDRVLGTAFSPDGRLLATGSIDTTVRLWDATTGSELRVLTGHTGRSWGVAFTPDGSRLASVGHEGTLRFWDVATGQTVHVITGGEPLTCVALSPDGLRVVAGAQSGHAYVWDARTGEPLLTLNGHTDTIWSVAFDQRGERLVTASRDSSARIWDADDGSAAGCATRPVRGGRRRKVQPRRRPRCQRRSRRRGEVMGCGEWTGAPDVDRHRAG
jgi:WD40 repeat protein/DNA-binding SARP family transcriptional activator